MADWMRVENKTNGWLTLPWPGDIHNSEKAETFSPYQIRVVSSDLFDTSTKQGYYNLQMSETGLIEISPVEGFSVLEEDRGRQAAMARKLADPNLEALARQILESDCESLPDTIDWRGDGWVKPSPGIIVKALIEAEPRTGTPGNRGEIQWQFLAETWRPFLASVLEREKLWRNRPAIVQLLEERIKELGDVAILKAQADDKLARFRAELGG